MNRGTFKLSTIHSFKGWESPVLFLVIEDKLKTQEHLMTFENKVLKPLEFSDELVYTGLTRCKDYLFVINLNNQEYHKFFTENKIVDNKI